MTIAPQNIVNPGPALTLADLYKITVGRMGYAPSQLPEALFFTFCGDLLGSSGEHYVKGQPISFASAVYQSSHSFSDDFMESLAMALMANSIYKTDPESLMGVRDAFYELLKDHFESAALTYSPWFLPLFAADNIPEYLQIIAGHASCGAAMRSAVLGALGTPLERVAPLMLCSHAHPEALEGAYMIYGFAQAAAAGEQDFDAALEAGFACADKGYDLAMNFLENQGFDRDGRRMRALCDLVWARKDPYATIHDIAEEGIETRFVVPAALWLVGRASLLEPDMAVRHIVEGALEIGGDPDTICSIAMGIYGLLAGKPAHDALAAITLPQKA